MATTKKATTKSVTNAQVLAAITGLAGRIDDIEAKQAVTAEAVTKAASGRGPKRRNYVAEIGADGNGHEVAVVQYKDGNCRLRLRWATSGGVQERDIPLDTYRQLAANIDEVESMLEELGAND